MATAAEEFAMGIAALLGLVEVSGVLVLDANGKIVLLPEGSEIRPVILSCHQTILCQMLS